MRDGVPAGGAGDAAERDAEVRPVRVRPRSVRLGSLLELLFASGLERRRRAEIEGDAKDH